MWQVVFKLEYLFCQDVKEGRIPILNLNELNEKSRTKNIPHNFVNKS